LQIAHPFAEEDYVHYKWRRLCQYLPSAKPPRLYEQAGSLQGESGPGSPDAGQWRIRVGSRHFALARNLLYPDGPGSAIRITSEPLELMGGEGIALLWADRGRIRWSSGGAFSQGRLNLSRFDWHSASLIAEWIGTISGAHGQIAPNPRHQEAPMLFFDHLAISRLLDVLSDTWVAQAACLKKRFTLKESDALREARLRTQIDADRHQNQLSGAAPSRRSSARRRGLPVVLPDVGHDPIAGGWKPA
jgi:hypothetical protein